MKTLNFYSVFIPKSPKEEKKFETKIVEVGLENETKIVLNDDSFTMLQKKSEFCNIYSVIGKPNIREWKTDIECLDGLHYTLYTHKTVRPETIQKQIGEWIDKNYGYFVSFDLSFIK